MSIDAVATSAQGSASAAQKGAPQGAAPATPFQDVLSAAAPQEPVSPATAAEILRLKMLNSALALGDDHPKAAAAGSTSMQGFLDRFLEQLPKGSQAQVPLDGGEASAVGAAEVAGAGVAAPADAVTSSPSTLEAIIDKASRRYGVDGGLIKAVIKAESDFNPRAVSPAGAQGLMQLMPATARGLGVTDPFDPEQNVMAGTRFLKDMLSRYGGNVEEALAAYNWGPSNVDRHGTDRLPRETQAYLSRVKGLYNQYVA